MSKTRQKSRREWVPLVVSPRTGGQKPGFIPIHSCKCAKEDPAKSGWDPDVGGMRNRSRPRAISGPSPGSTAPLPRRGATMVHCRGLARAVQRAARALPRPERAARAKLLICHALRASARDDPNPNPNGLVKRLVRPARGVNGKLGWLVERGDQQGCSRVAKLFAD
jgi:hypothetical protein